MKPKAAKPKAAKPKAKPTRKAPGLATAKSLRALFESAAVRQKAHDAGLDLQKRLRDHNAAIQQRMETHRLRDMARGDTPLTARVGRTMLGFDSGTRPRSRTPTRIIRRPRTPPGPIPRAPAPGQMPPPPPPPPTPRGTRRGPARYDMSPPPNTRRSR
jgi:pyruvate/2-oxoglutarate dehydrogenase complex dihydrolipoamide acyltransferase (E2) component